MFLSPNHNKCIAQVNFAYVEDKVKKNALVKLRLCPECAYKLNYKQNQKAARALKRAAPATVDDGMCTCICFCVYCIWMCTYAYVNMNVSTIYTGLAHRIFIMVRASRSS